MPEGWSLKLWQGTPACGSRAGSAQHRARAGAAAPFSLGTFLEHAALELTAPAQGPELMMRGPHC